MYWYKNFYTVEKKWIPERWCALPLWVKGKNWVGWVKKLSIRSRRLSFPFLFRASCESYSQAGLTRSAWWREALLSELKMNNLAAVYKPQFLLPHNSPRSRRCSREMWRWSLFQCFLRDIVGFWKLFFQKRFDQKIKTCYRIPHIAPLVRLSHCVTTEQLWSW